MLPFDYYRLKEAAKTNQNNNIIMNPSEIIFNYIFPWGGVIIANFMYSAPFKDVREASMTGDLGHLNPLPWAFMSGNTYGWYVLFCYYEKKRIKNRKKKRIYYLIIIFGGMPSIFFLIFTYTNVSSVLLFLCFIPTYPSPIIRPFCSCNHNKNDKLIILYDNRQSSYDPHIRRFNINIKIFLKQNRLTYGVLVQDPSVVAGSIVGFLLSIWLNMQAVKLQYARSYSEEMRKILLANKDGAITSNNNQEGHPDQLQQDGKRHRTLALDELQASINSLMHSDHDDDDDEEMVHRTSFDLIVLNVHHSLQKVKTVSQQETVVLYISTLWLAITLLISFTDRFTAETRKLIVGFTVNLNLIVFYGAPLSTIYTVINTHETKSIHVPTMLLNSLNAFFWTVYGITKADYFIYVPNGSGVLLGIIQITLCLLYPRYQPKIENEYDRLSNRRTIFLLPQHTIDIDDSRALARHSLSSRTSLSKRGGKMRTLIPDSTFYQGKTERVWL